MEIRLDSLDYSLPLEGDGPLTASKTVVFPRPVKTAVAGLTGYLAEFGSHDDHHVGRLELRLDTTIVDNTVTVDVVVPAGGVSGQDVQVQVTYGMRDWSGDWDDRYDGTIFFAVVGE
jgi:hypothetical protein